MNRTAVLRWWREETREYADDYDPPADERTAYHTDSLVIDAYTGEALTRNVHGDGRRLTKVPTLSQAKKHRAMRFSTERLVEMHNERARARGAIGDLTVRQWRELCSVFGGKCVYCQVQRSTVIEHITPISAGGATTLTNIAPACWSCNEAKHTKTLDQWVAERGLDLDEVTHRIASAHQFVLWGDDL